MRADTVTAICAVIVAVLALAVSVYQSYIGRKHNRLSVTPHLDFEVSYGVHGVPFGVYIMNNGIGPAALRSLAPTCDGEPPPTDGHPWLEVWTRAGFPVDYLVFHYLSVGDFLSAGGRFPLLTLDNEKKADELASALRDALRKVDLEVTYSCVYGDKLQTVRLADVDVGGT